MNESDVLEGEFEVVAEATAPAGTPVILEWWTAAGVKAPVITNYLPTTREYWGMSLADPSPLEPGVWLVPALAVLGKAPAAPQGHVMVLAADGATWSPVEDYRGQIVYSNDNHEGEVWETLGALPDGHTVTAPGGIHDEWTGEDWVENEESKLQELKANALEKKRLLDVLANANLTRLGLAVELGMATEQETADLRAWKVYTVLLGRVDVSSPTAVQWPVAPVGDDVNLYLANQGFHELDYPAAVEPEPSPEAQTPAE